VRDPYQVLGVSRDASGDEIKAAFRRLAREHHPDRNPGDDSAKERFQEINAAYQLLSDPDRRARFDRMGTDGPAAGAGGFAGGIEDWLSEILSGGFATASPPVSGDLREVLELEFVEAALGCRRTLSYERADVCQHCGGDGAERGARSVSCDTCGGAGRVRLGSLGWISLGMDRICPRCQGTGSIPSVRCSACDGRGLSVRRRNIEVTIPPGIEPGAAQTIVGGGSRVSPRGPAGDLELVIHVKPHARFRREGDDVLSDVEVAFTRAALGTEVEVETLHGMVTLKVPAGTQPGTVLPIRGKGVPHRFRSGAGDQLCRIKVRVPDGTKPQIERLIRQFDDELSNPSEVGLLGKLKELFSG